jgi:hypothetical protein
MRFDRALRCALRGLALAACGSLLLARAATAQNLAENGEFDVDIAGWDPATSAAWLDEDWQEDPESGSLRIVNASSTPTSILVAQCIPVEGGQPLVFEGAFRGALDGEATGRIRIGVSWRAAADCDSGSTILPYVFAVTVDAPADWTFASSEEFVAPAEAVAASVQLLATKTSEAGTLTADFDAIFVPEPGAGSAAMFAAFALAALRRARSAAAG